ncbi:endomembrane protein 70 protein family [Actinidia rufa]|uniref:Transmembrane 9 superfamily member n=1 Tax=Actinidia rufa TaxID=165716 RepID=A0A7J0DB55_9ERIC|nr:endomembrane protein 70 protein family [Actinidia rufa]
MSKVSVCLLQGDLLKVKVNKLTSIKTQLPYSYYSLPYCKPEKIVDSAENLGEVLRGDRIENSPYVFNMREPQMCKVACRITLAAKTAKEFKEKINDEYRVNMILDNLPLVVPITRLDQESSTMYQHGFHVGLRGQYAETKEEKYFIHNHLAFTVRFHKDPQTETARIVGFEVKPFSVNHEYEGDWSGKTRLTTCDAHAKRAVTNSEAPQEVEDKKEIIFTYDVEFVESNVKWAYRWDTYLLMADDQIHWFSIVNSLMIVLFLSGMVAMIMLRTLYRDISKYNQLETQEEAQEETGWKLIHGDVFRPPTNSDLLCVYVGTGVQFFGMILVTMSFAVLGFLSPSNRGGLMTAMLLLWVFMGIFAGYSSARLYKMFKGTEWKSITLRTAFMFPASVFAVFFVLNALIWGEKSSGAVPFGTMFALVVLWFGISVPLVFVGGYVGFKKPVLEDPVKTNKKSQGRSPNRPAILLHFRFPLHRLRDPNRHLCRDHDRALLFPAVQRGLPLVVEILSHFRILCALPLPLRRLLLLHEARDHEARFWGVVLRVHAHRLVRFLRAHWHDWVLRVLLVYEAHLLLSEDRLSDANRRKLVDLHHLEEANISLIS